MALLCIWYVRKNDLKLVKTAEIPNWRARKCCSYATKSGFPERGPICQVHVLSYNVQRLIYEYPSNKHSSTDIPFSTNAIQLFDKSYEPVHEISNNVVCATSIASDQPAHTRSLIRAFASRLSTP